MKKIVCVAALLLCMCRVSFADDASKRAKIDEMFTLMRMQETMDRVVLQQQKQVKEMLPGMFPDVHLTADQQKMMDTFLAKVMALSRESLDWKKLEPQFIDLYASTYDESTVDALLAFYRSDAGKTMIAKQPELIDKSQVITKERLAEMQPKMRELFQEFMVELMKTAPTPAKQ